MEANTAFPTVDFPESFGPAIKVNPDKEISASSIFPKFFM